VEEKCEVCSGNGQRQETKKLKINIPAGVDNGTRLRVSDAGDAGQRSGPAGDLYVYLFVNEDPEFQREGINLLSELKISYVQAILGSRVEVNTVDNEPQELLIPPGTQSGKVLTLEGKGVPKLGNPVSRGDYLITISIDIPTKISVEERELLEKLAKLRGDRIGKSGIEGFFGKVFGT